MKCSECECLVRVKNKLGYNLYYCGYKKYGVLKALCGLYINNEEYRKDNETCKYYKAEKKGRKEMTDEEKVNDIYDICLEKKSIYCNRKMGEETCSNCKTYQMYKLGLAKGRKEKQKIIDTQTVGIESREVYLAEKENIIIRQQIEIQELKAEKQQIIERERVVPEHYLIEMIEKNKELKAQISTLLSCSNCPDNKGGYICDKEYNNKCLAQKIQYINELKKQLELKKC